MIPRLAVALGCAALTACASVPLTWQPSEPGITALLDSRWHVQAPPGWMHGAYAADGRTRIPAAEDVALIASTKDAWSLQQALWRRLSARQLRAVYGAQRCDSVECERLSWQRYYESLYGKDKVVSTGHGASAIANCPSLRLSWRLERDGQSWEQVDYLLLDAGATYQFSFAAPAGFFFRQDLAAFETAVAATRRTGVAGP